MDYDVTTSYELAIRHNRKAYDEIRHKLTQNPGEMLRYRRRIGSKSVEGSLWLW